MEPRTSLWTAIKLAFVLVFRGEKAALAYSEKLIAKGK